MAAIAAYHQHLTGGNPEASIDERTWRDLDLDLVYALLDRTVSSVGQQRLYHRLRSKTSVHTLEAFESLVTLMTADTSSRERCQVALAPLRRAAAFGIWRLLEAGALEPRPIDVLSPLLALAMLAATAATLWSPAAFAGAVAIARLLDRAGTQRSADS